MPSDSKKCLGRGGGVCEDYGSCFWSHFNYNKENGDTKLTKLDIVCCDICKNFHRCPYGCYEACRRRGITDNADHDMPLKSLGICTMKCLLRSGPDRCPADSAGFEPMTEDEAICDAI